MTGQNNCNSPFPCGDKASQSGEGLFGQSQSDRSDCRPDRCFPGNDAMDNIDQKNYKLTVSYDGTGFRGWQKQKGQLTDTIQGRLEHVASLLNGFETEVNGAGRTDAGVHALKQVANVFVRGNMTAAEVKDYFNRYLPEAVSVDSCEEVPDRFHARLSATGKTYQYNVCEAVKAPVFLRKYVYCYGREVDLKKMRQACADLVGTHDFKGFCSAVPKKKSTVRTITEASVTKGKFAFGDAGAETVKITLSGDGFLYNEVRIIAGTLLEIGSGSLPADTVIRVLETGDRGLAGFTAPPEGLFLTDVRY